MSDDMTHEELMGRLIAAQKGEEYQESGGPVISEPTPRPVSGSPASDVPVATGGPVSREIRKRAQDRATERSEWKAVTTDWALARTTEQLREAERDVDHLLRVKSPVHDSTHERETGPPVSGEKEWRELAEFTLGQAAMLLDGLVPGGSGLAAEIRKLLLSPVCSAPSRRTCVCGEVPMDVVHPLQGEVVNGHLHRMNGPCYLIPADNPSGDA